MTYFLILLFWVTFCVVYYFEYKRKCDRDKKIIESFQILGHSIGREFANLAKILSDRPSRDSSNNFRDNEKQLITESTTKSINGPSIKEEDQTFTLPTGLPKPAVKFGDDS